MKKRDLPIFVYITCKNDKQAKAIAVTLLQKKLIFCANIFSKIHSIYLWKNRIENATESVLILKSFNKNFQKIVREVKKPHSYDTPCIVAFSSEKAEQNYLAWANSAIN